MNDIILQTNGMYYMIKDTFYLTATIRLLPKPKSQTLNPKPQTLTPKPQTSNLKP